MKHSRKSFKKHGIKKSNNKSKQKFNNSKRKSNKKQIKKHGRSRQGGEVIGHGGFGCVFQPALPCAGTTTRSDGVSKMLLNRDAVEEWNEIINVQSITKQIPNYNKYFLITESPPCQPGQLNDSDKINLQTCNRLKSKGITNSTINSKLSDVKILNQPFGGKDIFHIFADGNYKFTQINTALIDLLLNGIVPMNKLGLFHFDVKDGNILYNNNDGHARLIDWGLAGTSTSQNIIPKKTRELGFSYNLPFSSRLFMSEFSRYYNYYLSTITTSNPIPFETINKVLLNYYDVKEMDTYYGHLQDLYKVYLPYILKHSEYSNLSMEELKKIVSVLITRYWTTIVMKYTDFENKKFNLELYFKEVYSVNADVYGFIMGYIYLLRQPYFLRTREPKSEISAYQVNIANIIIKYCFSTTYAAKPYNFNELVNDLKNIKNPSYSTNATINTFIENVLKPHVSASPSPKVESLAPVSSKIESLDPGSPPKSSPKSLVKLGSMVTSEVLQDVPEMVAKSLGKPTSVQPPPKRKYCPKGTRKNRKTGECEPITKSDKVYCPDGTHKNRKTKVCEEFGQKSDKKLDKIPTLPLMMPTPKSRSPIMTRAATKKSSPKNVTRVSPLKRGKCPKGTRKDIVTGNCEPLINKPSSSLRAIRGSPAKLSSSPRQLLSSSIAKMAKDTSPVDVPVKRSKCPKGTRKDIVTGNCEPIIAISTSRRAIRRSPAKLSSSTRKSSPRKSSPRKSSQKSSPRKSSKKSSPRKSSPPTKKKRCPNGTRRNKETGECEPKK